MLVQHKIQTGFTVALVAGVLLLCGGFYLREASHIEKSLLVQESAQVDALARLFQHELHPVADDLRQFANGDGLRAYLATGQAADLDRAIQQAVFFSRLNPQFDQIRYLNEQGREVLRVNQNGQIVPPGELQDKSDRPYFQKTFQLAPGQMYLSALDLNVEHGQVEQPPKPMLRLAVPVFDETGRRRGVCIINCLADGFFAHLQEYRPDLQHRLRVFNAQGYLLKAAQPEQEWGFMFPDRNGLTLASNAPTLWAQLAGQSNGKSRHAGGILTWQRVDLRQLVADDPDSVVAEDQFLIVASEISGEEYGAFFSELRTVFGILTGLLLVAALVSGRLLSSRRQAQAALRRSEENLTVTLQSIGDAVLATDTEGRVTRLNRIAEKLTGWTHAEALGRPVKEVFHIINEATREPSVIPVDKVLATGEIHGLANHTIIIARDGTERPIADSAAPIRDKDGNILGVVLVFRDVTEEKKAERVIRESEAYNRSIVESSPDCLKLLSLDGRILYMAPGGCRIMEVDDFCTIENADWLTFWKGEDKTAAQRALETACAGGTGRFRGFCPTAKGSPRWWDVAVTPIVGADGRPVKLLAVSRDITERKRLEEELRNFSEGLEELVAKRTGEVREALATLDATADGAYIFDPASLRFTHVNKGAVRQLGYTREELLKLTPLDLNTQLDEPAYREMIAPLLRGEKSVLAFESVYHRKDGGKFPVEINLQYITPPGSSPRFISIVRDISERKKNEQQARRSQRMESIGTLAGGIAHDLNNALGPIMMGGEWLRSQYPGESQTLDMIKASTQRAADMVKQLLGFAKGTEGERVVLQPERLVREMQKIITASFPKNIELVVKCDPKLQAVLGDATQLHQVLLNLCVNARDAMPSGGTLTLEAENREVDAMYASSLPDGRPGKYVVLRVTDTGAGMPPEIIERIFDPFFSTKGPDKGTGLGLSTVMGIVKGHGGFIQVYSQPEIGSIFTAYLPASTADKSDMEHVAKTKSAFRGQGETILFVDDETGMREMARAVLRRLNFKPVVATNGTDGLMQAAQIRAELRAVITDLHMPQMDGLAFARELRRVMPDIPVIVTSGRMEDALAAEFKALGVTVFLDKPFTEAQLVAALKDLLAPK